MWNVLNYKMTTRNTIIGPAASADAIQTLEAKDKDALASIYPKIISAYHYINDKVIKEGFWEDINAEILSAADYKVYSKADGSHKPGADIKCSFGSFSNKTSKYEKSGKLFKISSYRLTKVCKADGTDCIESIKKEINDRKNFQFYSIIVRDESSKGKKIKYDWYLIPATDPIFDPETYKWSPMTGKTRATTNKIQGWTTEEVKGCKMSISYAMSSQLWIDVSVTDELKKHLIASTTINIGKKLSLLDIYNKFIATPSAPLVQPSVQPKGSEPTDPE